MHGCVGGNQCQDLFLKHCLNSKSFTMIPNPSHIGKGVVSPTKILLFIMSIHFDFKTYLNALGDGRGKEFSNLVGASQ